MPRALVLIRLRPEHRIAAIRTGLARAGYEPADDWDGADPRPGDVCVTWNLIAHNARRAALFAAAGGRVAVLEEGYLRAPDGARTCALALGGHNGAGTFPEGGPERFGDLGVALAPWRRTGRHVLVCASRGIGPPGMAQPRDWPAAIVRRLAAATGRPIRYRRHPRPTGPQIPPPAVFGPARSPVSAAAARYEISPPGRPLADDLADAWAAVVWNSNSATAALAAGVPVVAEAPAIITGHLDEGGACLRSPEMIDDPPLPDRLPAFRRLAWAQWTLQELATGAPFARLLG